MDMRRRAARPAAHTLWLLLGWWLLTGLVACQTERECERMIHTIRTALAVRELLASDTRSTANYQCAVSQQHSFVVVIS
jgi:hypothetical protein